MSCSVNTDYLVLAFLWRIFEHGYEQFNKMNNNMAYVHNYQFVANMSESSFMQCFHSHFKTIWWINCMYERFNQGIFSQLSIHFASSSVFNWTLLFFCDFFNDLLWDFFKISVQKNLTSTISWRTGETIFNKPNLIMFWFDLIDKNAMYLITLLKSVCSKQCSTEVCRKTKQSYMTLMISLRKIPLVSFR